MKNVLLFDLPWVTAWQQHFCKAMCDHVLVNVYILLFAAKYVKHKLTHKRYLLYTPREF